MQLQVGSHDSTYRGYQPLLPIYFWPFIAVAYLSLHLFHDRQGLKRRSRLWWIIRFDIFPCRKISLTQHRIQMSTEKSCLFRVYGGYYILHSYMGIVINHESLLNNQYSIESRSFFFSWLTCPTDHWTLHDAMPLIGSGYLGFAGKFLDHLSDQFPNKPHMFLLFFMDGLTLYDLP